MCFKFFKINIIFNILLFTFREREIILFDVVRSYEELLEKIKREKVSNIVDLPCYEDNTERNNNNDDYIECLPELRRGVLVVNDFEIERLKYSRVISNNTDGDTTKINDVDRFYDFMWDNPINYHVDFTEQRCV